MIEHPVSAFHLQVHPTYPRKLLVEAQNFVPYIWAPRAEGASGATGYARDHFDP